MSVFTTGQYDASIWTPAKTIHATHTEAVSFFRGLVTGVTALIGGKQDILNKKMDDVTDALMKKIKDQIDSDQCVVGFSIELTEFGRSETNTTISGLAMGTLLKKKMKGGAHFNIGRTTEGRGGDNQLQLFIKAAAANDVRTMQQIIKEHPYIPDSTYVHGKDAAETALIKAASNGHLNAVKYLLKIGGEEATRNTSSSFGGETALHRAALHGHADVVEAILDAGANPEPGASTSRFTPAEYAFCKNHDDIVEILEEAGSSPPREAMCKKMQGMGPRGGSRKKVKKTRKSKARRHTKRRTA